MRVLLVVVGALWQGGALGAVLGQLAAAVAGCSSRSTTTGGNGVGAATCRR
ncbi:MAG: hypothetical protein R3E96_08385 [Planctomycetota bacterium]